MKMRHPSGKGKKFIYYEETSQQEGQMINWILRN